MGSPGIFGMFGKRAKVKLTVKEDDPALDIEMPVLDGMRTARILREKDPGLEPVEVFLRDGYRSEHDAMRLLHMLGAYYEPVRLIGRRRKAAPPESADKN